MTDQSVSRRGILRAAGGLTALGAVGGLSGCSQVQNAMGDGETPSIETVPAGSQYVLEVDFTAIYGDDGLRDGINGEISDVREEMQSQQVPENVTTALNQIESGVGLDPRSMSQAILSGTYESEAEYDQAAYTLWAEWGEDELVSSLEEEGATASEESYDDTTLYVQDREYGASTVLAVLAGGVYSVGTRTHVEATIDTYNGDADPLGGEVRSGYDASTDGHVRYAFDVVASEVPESTGTQFDASVFREVTHGYGSLSPDGDDRVMTVQMETGSEEAATDISDLVQGGLTLAEQRIEASEMEDSGDAEDSEAILTALDATEVSTEGTTASITHARPAAEFAAVATPILLSFVLPQGTQPQTTAPQASFSFDYEADASALTITHDGGDTVDAFRLSIDGQGFTEADGVDMTSPGMWRGDANSDGMVRAGDSVTVGVTSDYSVSVVWTSQGGGSSTTLAQAQGPDA